MASQEDATMTNGIAAPVLSPSHGHGERIPGEVLAHRVLSSATQIFMTWSPALGNNRHMIFFLKTSKHRKTSKWHKEGMNNNPMKDAGNAPAGGRGSSEWAGPERCIRSGRRVYLPQLVGRRKCYLRVGTRWAKMKSGGPAKTARWASPWAGHGGFVFLGLALGVPSTHPP